MVSYTIILYVSTVLMCIDGVAIDYVTSSLTATEEASSLKIAVTAEQADIKLEAL